MGNQCFKEIFDEKANCRISPVSVTRGEIALKQPFKETQGR
jgi:hypothetical protein